MAMKNKTQFLSRKGSVFIFVLISVLLASAPPSFKTHAATDISQDISPHPKITQRLQNTISASAEKDKPLKVWIYFTDKGISSRKALKKKLKEVRQSLDEHCLWRRRKTRSEKNLVDLEDLPLLSSYVQKIAPLVNRVRATSRWLNALSVEMVTPQISSLARLDCIHKIDLVLSFRREDRISRPDRRLIQEEENSVHINYGPSYLQLAQINVPPLHRLGYSGKGVRVCLMDTGFRKSHEVFQQANLIDEWDFVNDDNDVAQNLLDPEDYTDSHGTGTWSVLGGYNPGELVGPAYGADFLLAKTETTRFEEPIEEDYWVAGIEWAERLGTEVVSSSLGYTDWYSFEDMDGQTAVTTRAANRAASLGVVVVNSVGNERNNPWGHLIAPSDGFDVIAAGAVDAFGLLASFSSPGPSADGRIKPEVCARGVENWLAGNSSAGNDEYRTGSGTSFSAPLVGGVAALLLEIHRDWTPAQVRSALLSTADRSQNPDNDYGWGIIDAFAAAGLDMAQPQLHAFTVDDDADGPSSGNGNGITELGEIIEIKVTLENNTQISALSLKAELRSTHPEIEIIQSEVPFPALPPANTVTSSEPFVARIPASFFRHHLVFRLKVEGPNSLTLYDSLRIPIAR